MSTTKTKPKPPKPPKPKAKASDKLKKPAPPKAADRPKTKTPARKTQSQPKSTARADRLAREAAALLAEKLEDTEQNRTDWIKGHVRTSPLEAQTKDALKVALHARFPDTDAGSLTTWLGKFYAEGKAPWEKSKTCPQCKRTAEGIEAGLAMFGHRYDGHQFQAWCNNCRQAGPEWLKDPNYKDAKAKKAERRAAKEAAKEERAKEREARSAEKLAKKEEEEVAARAKAPAKTKAKSKAKAPAKPKAPKTPPKSKAKAKSAKPKGAAEKPAPDATDAEKPAPASPVYEPTERVLGMLAQARAGMLGEVTKGVAILNVKELRAFLQRLDVENVDGKKDELIKRVIDNLPTQLDLEDQAKAKAAKAAERVATKAAKKEAAKATRAADKATRALERRIFGAEQ